ncbi:MAG: hypothetical protein V2A34_01185, partial [Lentisphaerota bacterium]
ANGWEMRGVGDIKGDGTMAVLWHNSITKKVAYWFLNTDGTLATAGFSYSGTMTGGWELKATADINDDGTMDAIWFNTSTRKAACWMMGVSGAVSTSVFCSATAMTSGYTLYTAGLCQPSAMTTSWVAEACLPLASAAGAAGVLNESLYYVGGVNDQGARTNVFRFNGTNWVEVAGLSSGRWGHAVSVFNGRLYAMAGSKPDASASTNVYRFDGTNWVEVAGLPAGRCSLASAVLGDRLYALGGESYATNVFRYDGTNWAEVAGLPEGRQFMGVAALNGFIYVVGGTWSANATTNVFRYDGTNWVEVAGLPSPVYYHSLSALNGALYSAGGQDNSHYSTNVFRFNGTNWTEVAGLPQTMEAHASGVLNGSLYVMGGYDGVASSYITNAFRYNP